MWQISPIGNDQFFSSNGTLAVGYKLFTYLAGTTTKEPTAADFDGLSFHTNPIVLDSLGLPPFPIYIDANKAYKFVYAPPGDTDPPASPVYTVDNITVKNLSPIFDEWVAGTTPTYISATQFSVAGDQRTIYHVGRRVRLIASGSTVYGVISASAFVAVTTVTVLVDDGLTISASLNSVFYGLLSAAGSSWPVGYNTGLKQTLNVIDARTNTVNTPLEINAQTTGTPAIGIGTGMVFRAESSDETPSDVGQFEFVASDVGPGSEDTYFQILLRVAGAALSKAYRFIATSAFAAIFTHANTADRTYRLSDRDMRIGAGDRYIGPSSIESGSTAVHEGSVTISVNQALSGIHFYTDFTLDPGVTLTVDNNAGHLTIIATGTVTINGIIDGIGAGGAGGIRSEFLSDPGFDGAPGFAQPGGGGGQGSNGPRGGNGGISHSTYGRGGTTPGGGGIGNGSQGTHRTGALVGMFDPYSISGGSGGGSGGTGLSGLGGNGGAGGASVALVAPTVILGAASQIKTSGSNGSSPGHTSGGGGGGGGAGNFYVMARSYTDNGCTFTQTAGSGAGSGGTGGDGGAGRAGVKQILIYD